MTQQQGRDTILGDLVQAVVRRAERDALVLQYQGLIRWTWNRNRREKLLARLGEDDACAAGQLGLLRAAQKFDPIRGVKFTTYAVRWVYSFMQRAAQRHLIVHLPEHVLRGTAPQRLVDAGAVFSKILRLEYTRNRRADPSIIDPPAPPADRHPWDLELYERVEEALRHIHPSRREPLVLHYRDGLGLREIAERLGLKISRERMRQIIEQGVKQLCDHLGLVWIAACKGRQDRSNRKRAKP